MAKSNKKKNTKVAISKSPTLCVTGLKKPARSESSSHQNFTATWAYPKNAFSESNAGRFEGVLVEWTIDYDSDSSAVSGKKKLQTISGTKKSSKTVYPLKGEKYTSHTFSVPRSDFYPLNGSKGLTLVKLYMVVKSKKVKKTVKSKGKTQQKTVTTKTKYIKNKKTPSKSRWSLVYQELPLTELSEVNKREKRNEVFSEAALTKASAKSSPVGKIFYKSKTKSGEVIKITKKNPIVYGIGVRVQGWNSKTPTKKNKRKKVTTKKNGKTTTTYTWVTPPSATKDNVLWNESAPTQAAYFTFAVPRDPKKGSETIAAGSSNHTVTFSFTDHDDAQYTGDDGTTTTERYDTYLTAYRTMGLYDKSGKFKTHAKKSIEIKTPTGKEMTYNRYPNTELGAVDMAKTVNSLRPNEYLKYEISAYNRGMRGNSGTLNREFLIACPHDVSIKSITERGPLYEISFTRKAGAGGLRKTSTYTLQRLYNFRPTKGTSEREVDDWSDKEWLDAAKSQPDSAWTDVAVLGHNNDAKWNVQTFTDKIINAKPDPFKRSYYRVVAANTIDGIASIHSDPKVVPGFLRIPSAKDAKVDILACCSAENGNAIQATVAFNKSTYSPLEIEVGTAFPANETIYELNASTGAYFETSDKTARANKTYYVDTGFANSNGTEMSWDTFEYAWQSSQLPSSYDFKDAQLEGYLFPVTSDAKSKYAALGKAKIGWIFTTYYLRGIQSSTKYYIKGRRFLKDTETRETDSYGGYSDYTGDGTTAIAVETKATPTEVKLTAPERLVEGKDLSVSWAYDSADTQKGYQLLAYPSKPQNGASIETAGDSKTLLDSGTKEDSAPYAVVPWANVKECLVGVEGSKDHLYTAVHMYTEAGNWSKISEIQETRIVRPPRASLSQIPQVKSRDDFSVTFGTNDNQCAIVVRIVAHQLMDWGPAGADNVAEGTIVYSAKLLNVDWQETTLTDGSKWYTKNSTFDGLDLRNNGEYTVEYTAVNDEYDLDSDTVDDEGNIVKQTTTFTVKYDEDLTVPPFYVVADPIDEEHSGYARITVLDTPDENKDCVVDLYRVTPSGAYLVYKGLADWRGSTFIDHLPPYCRHEPCVYRLAIRSKNGVVEWADRSYVMPGYSVRFDWGDPSSEDHGQYTHLTLPYNLKWSDSWTKNSRVDLHLDGTYNGYWRGGVDHKNTLNTELVKLTGPEQVARVMALAKYAGPVMVRLPNGCAFAADVQVSNLDTSYDSLTISASFSAQEIRLPNEFAQQTVFAEKGLYVPQS